MKVMRLLLGFIKKKESDYIDLGASAVEGMTDNVHFPDLQPQVAIFTESYEAFLASIPAKNVRNQINMAVMEEKKAKYVEDMIWLGHLIMAEAKGDEVKLISSGYRTSKMNTHKKPIPATPTMVEASITNGPQTLQVNCKSNSDADAYIARVVAQGVEGSPWTNFDSSSKVLVHGIATGVMLEVQMKLKNASGESGWSNKVLARLPLPSEPILKKVNV